MAQLKKLYKGKCLDDLEKYYSVPDIRKNKLPTILNTARKLYENAERNLLDGDEELSYIFFMKYFNLIEETRKLPDYSQQKQYVSKMIGSRTHMITALDKAEKLSNSLKRRYQVLGIEHENSLRQNNNNYFDSQNGVDLEIDDFEKTVNSISPEKLYKMTQDPKISLLIIDCRSKRDFNLSKLRFPTLNVPEEIILVGMSAGKLQQQLDQESRAMWSSRAIKDHIVLLDWSSKGPEPIMKTPISRLKDILENWDPDVAYKSPIKILQGGFENFILKYPTQCTNPNVQPPAPLISDIEVLDDIEYPSISDITMKDEKRYGSQKVRLENDTAARPDIDRNSKIFAMKTYGEKEKLEILKEQKTLMAKALENEKKRLDAENKWKNFADMSNNTETDDQKKNLPSREQELLYNIMQLESNERDYKQKNELLMQQLEEYKRRERENGEIVAAKETEKLEQSTKNIIKERQEIDEEREKYTKEREKKLALAREQKRDLKTPVEEIPKPKIPQIDRTIKPIEKSEREIVETLYIRDFSPVSGSPGRGLTGLKNLGNTCYMNSIMQCLSNSPLADYFISNSYTNHLNLSNKTRGRIAEEVAALIKVLWNGRYKCIASKDLRYVLGQYQQMFRGVEQQDSHEFLTILMDWLHSDLQTLRINESPRSKLRAPEKAWLEFTKSCESQILRLFYGQIKSTIKCCFCEHESWTYECFSNLSLELPPTNSQCALKDCLDMYFHGEEIRGWNCSKCNQKRNAVKKLDISKLPPVLVIHFKRFYADTDTIGNIYKKKQNYVRFPLNEFSMSPYIARSEKMKDSKKYHLCAISNHYGSMESGHYTAFCRSSVLESWFKFDDQIVSPMDPSDVVSSAAYILFYSHLPDIPPSEII